MKIEGTELEYNEAEGVCLDYFLGEHHETKEQWAQRVWKNCNRWKEGYRTAEEGGKLASVYARCPYSLWEEKKRCRRVKFIKECTGECCDPHLCSQEYVEYCIENKENWGFSWPETHCDVKVMEIKNDPKRGYKTATEKHREEIAKEKEIEENITLEIAKNVATLQVKGFDEETIGIIYPAGKGI